MFSDNTRLRPELHKGETTTIRAVRGEFCPACGESVLGAAESKRVSAAMLEFNKQVNASIVDPGFIARVRKKLALDQRQAAAIFGGGPNAFSRYEKARQNRRSRWRNSSWYSTGTPTC